MKDNQKSDQASSSIFDDFKFSSTISVPDHRHQTPNENFICNGMNNFHLNDPWFATSESRVEQQRIFDTLQRQKTLSNESMTSTSESTYMQKELMNTWEQHNNARLTSYNLNNQAAYWPTWSNYQNHPSFFIAEFNKFQLNHAEMMRKNIFKNCRIPSNNLKNLQKHRHLYHFNRHQTKISTKNQCSKTDHKINVAEQYSRKTFRNMAPPKKKWMKNFIRGKYQKDFTHNENWTNMKKWYDQQIGKDFWMLYLMSYDLKLH